MAKKKGDKYKCEECGLVVVVEDPCGCEVVELLDAEIVQIGRAHV